jgi:hypothetical protein
MSEAPPKSTGEEPAHKHEDPMHQESAHISEAAEVEGVTPQRTTRSFAAAFAFAAWLVPGLGHILLRRWIKGAAFFVAVAGLSLAGYAMRGDAFAPGSDGPLGTLGFLADAGSGVFYFASRWLESVGPDLSRAAGDYGTRLIAAAGIVNALAIIDAYEIGGRRRD